MKRQIAKTYAGFFFCLALAISIGSASTAQMTEAEQAAQSERGLTPAENALKQAACELRFTKTPMDGLPAGVNASEIELPASETLLIAWAMEREALSENLDISIFPYLPAGGIGFRDYCGPVYMFPLPPLEQGWPLLVIGLRLRPGLDIKSDYPTAYSQIRSNNQYRIADVGKFALIDIGTLASPDLYYQKFKEIFALFEQNEIIDQTRSALVLAETQLLLPIK